MRDLRYGGNILREEILTVSVAMMSVTTVTSYPSPTEVILDTTIDNENVMYMSNTHRCFLR